MKYVLRISGVRIQLALDIYNIKRSDFMLKKAMFAVLSVILCFMLIFISCTVKEQGTVDSKETQLKKVHRVGAIR